MFRLEAGSDHHDLDDGAPVAGSGRDADAAAGVHPGAGGEAGEAGARRIGRWLDGPLGRGLADGGLPLVHHAVVADIADGFQTAADLAVFGTEVGGGCLDTDRSAFLSQRIVAAEKVLQGVRRFVDVAAEFPEIFLEQLAGGVFGGGFLFSSTSGFCQGAGESGQTGGQDRDGGVGIDEHQASGEGGDDGVGGGFEFALSAGCDPIGGDTGCHMFW